MFVMDDEYGDGWNGLSMYVTVCVIPIDRFREDGANVRTDLVKNSPANSLRRAANLLLQVFQICRTGRLVVHLQTHLTRSNGGRRRLRIRQNTLERYVRRCVEERYPGRR